MTQPFSLKHIMKCLIAIIGDSYFIRNNYSSGSLYYCEEWEEENLTKHRKVGKRHLANELVLCSQDFV